MRHPYDSGASPNTRYENAPKIRSIPLTSSQMIRIFAEYNKLKKVHMSMIRIQEVGEFLWFTIWDKHWKYQLNGKYVRVRMVESDINVIYLFDVDTDTYLTFIKRDLEVAGDKASMTQADENQILAYHQKKKGLRRHREKQVEEDMAYLEEHDRDLPDLPESFYANSEIIVKRGEKKQNKLKEPSEAKKNNSRGSVARSNKSKAIATIEEVSIGPSDEQQLKLDNIEAI